MNNKEAEKQLEKLFNLYGAWTILITVAIYLLVWIADELEIFYVGKIYMRSGAFLALFLIIPTVVFVLKHPFRDISKVKYILLADALILTFFLMVFLNAHVVLVLALPFFLSMHYRSNRMNLITGVGTAAIALTAPILSYYLHTYSVDFYAWLIWLIIPDLATEYPLLFQLISSLDLSPIAGVIIFLALPNTLICLAYGVMTINIAKARTKIQQKWISEIEDISMEKEHAMELADAKAQFLSTMSHEIRTPLNAIIGMNTAILRESGEEKILEYATDVDNAGKMLLALINDILDYSKLEAGKTKLQFEEYEVTELVSFCEKIVKTRAEDKGLKLVVNVDEKMPSVLYGDVRRIKQVVTNLLTNAVKYTPKGQVRLSFLSPEFTETGMDLSIRVADTGEGIREESLEKLFTPFDRINEKEHQNIEGTGIGLAITQKLIDLMGGSIDVKSTFGKGSIFTITVPQAIIDEAPIGSRKKEQKHEKTESNDLFVAPNAHILVVDDVDLNIKVAKALLTTTQVNIDDASSGDECIELLQKKKYDLVLLDHSMPVKDGVQTLKEIKEMDNPLNADVPIIALTANYSADAKSMYKSLGFDDYLAKPFSVDELQKMVAKYLGNKASERKKKI